MWNNCNSHTLLVGMQRYSHFRNSMVISYKVKHTLPYDPEILFIGIYPREIKSYVHTKMYMQMFTAVFIHNSQKLEVTQIFINW